jgi:hypothetical protein
MPTPEKSAEPKPPPAPESVTGRDGYIIQKALAYAAHYIVGLPREHQEASDQNDMLCLLRHLNPTKAGRSFLMQTTGAKLEQITGRPFSWASIFDQQEAEDAPKQ